MRKHLFTEIVTDFDKCVAKDNVATAVSTARAPAEDASHNADVWQDDSHPQEASEQQ